MAPAQPLRLKDCPNLAAFCRCFESSPPSTTTLRGAFVLLTKYLFANSKNLDGFEDTLGCALYSDDPLESQLNIQAGSVLDPGDTENIPGIVVSLGKEGVTYQRDYINARSGASPDFSHGNVTYIAKVNITFLIRNYNPDICGLMADAIVMFFTAVEPVLRDTFGWLRDYKPNAQTDPNIASTSSSSSDKWYESNVSFELTYAYSVFVAQESKRLKESTIKGHAHIN